jgi:hypothetical protein
MAAAIVTDITSRVEKTFNTSPTSWDGKNILSKSR